MKVLAIDPGYDRIGIAVVEKSEHTNFKEILIYSECYVTDRLQDITERIYNVGQRIEYLIKENNPDIVAIESLFFTNNQKTAIGVSEAKGVFKYIARNMNITVREYTPLQIKVALTGSGKATKEQIARMVPKIIKFDMAKKITTHGLDDEIDAIAVALTCFAHERTFPHS